LTNEARVLTNVYGPCQGDRKVVFIDWFSNFDMLDDKDYIIMGDFDFIRQPSDRNKSRGYFNDMLLFSKAIIHLGLVE
jgi:hypothetical protein